MFLGTYSPEGVILAINNWQVTDFANGSMIDVNQNAQNFTQVRGIRGEHSYSKNRDKSGVVTFRIMQTSPTNNVLSQIAALDDLNMTGKMTVTLRDTSGSSIYTFREARLQGTPDVSYASGDTNAREWRILYNRRQTYEVGGNQVAPLDILRGII